MAGRDITEGRSTRAIAVDVGVVSNTSIWQNTDIAYDVAIGGQPFIYAISDGNPYIRQTAPFRKEQFDNQTEPGEQSLTGWWIRSQSSFHNGAGITFFDPALVSNEGAYRFADSQGVDVWTEGQVTLLSSSTTAHVTTHPIESNGRSFQQLRSIQWTTSGTTYDGVLLHDGYDVDKIDTAGAETHFIDSPECTLESYHYKDNNWDLIPTIDLFHKLTSSLELDSLCDEFNSKRNWCWWWSRCCRW